MSDLFRGLQSGLTSPASYINVVAPSDTADLPTTSRALNVATSGLVQITTVGGSTGTIYVAAGGVFPVRVSRVWATGTDATGIVALY